MKRAVVSYTLMVFTTLMLLASCARDQVVERQTTIREVPSTSSTVVVQPQRPATWVPGYWSQSGDTMVWRQGHWE